MTLLELSHHVAYLTGLHQRYAERAVRTIFEQMAEALARGEDVIIRGFGRFWVKHVPSYQVRGLWGGVTVPAHNRVIFKPYHVTKEELRTLDELPLDELRKYAAQGAQRALERQRKHSNKKPSTSRSMS